VNPRQQLFVQEYLKDLNASAAYVRAGYKTGNPDVCGPRLLGTVGVKAQVDAALEARKKTIQIDAAYVLDSIKSTMERCKQAEPVTNSRGQVVEGEWQFRENGVLKGAELLGRHLGMYKDRIEHSGSIAIRVLSVELKAKIVEDQTVMKKIRDALDAISKLKGD
jgi:phage terminase small subunit